MGKKKKRQDFAEEEDLEEGLEPEAEDEGEDMGEGGQEPRDEKPQEGDNQTEDDGRIDIEALPDDVKAAFKKMLAQLREKNREARNLRKRLEKLQKGKGKEGDDTQAPPAKGNEPSAEESELLKRLEQAERERKALLERVRQQELSQAITEAAVAAHFREDALEEVEALMRLKLGDDLWDVEGGVDKEAIADFLEDLKERKPYLLKPKKQKKPKINDGAGRKPAPSNEDDEERRKNLAIRFGL